MRLKLTALIVGVTVTAGSAVALAAPVTVGLYQFKSQADVRAFQKVQGASCAKGWRKRATLGISVGKATNACGFRSSVIADSSDPGPDQEMAAAVNLAASTPAKVRKRIYLGVAVRHGAGSSYQLRLLPQVRRWQVWRDPRDGNPALLATGTGPFINQGAGKRNNLLLRAFDRGTSTVNLFARVNGRTVLSRTDTGSVPNGRRTVVIVGSTGQATAYRAVGSFANVAVRVPDPF